MGTVDREPGGIAGGEFRAQAADLQAGLHRQAAGWVADHREACGQRVGLHAGAPDHGPGSDPFAGGEHRAASIDCGDRDPRSHFHAQRRQCPRDHWPRIATHVGANPGGPVG